MCRHIGPRTLLILKIYNVHFKGVYRDDQNLKSSLSTPQQINPEWMGGYIVSDIAMIIQPLGMHATKEGLNTTIFCEGLL